MNPLEIVKKYYTEGSELYKILVQHSTSVRDKALDIAARHTELSIDTDFVNEAAMFHDIGIFMTNAKGIYCFGKHHYIEHGYLGSELLQKEGLPKHALVCERHTGAGLRLDEIIAQGLPLPHRDMMPLSIEEQVICFADCFYSKTKLEHEKSIESIRQKMKKFGERSVNQFDKWCEMFL